MKKILFLVCVFIALSNTSHAQDTVQYMSPKYMFLTRNYISSQGFQFQFAGSNWNTVCCTWGYVFDGDMIRFTTTDPVLVYGISMTTDEVEKYDFDVVLAYMADDSSMVFIDSTSWKASDHQAFFSYSLVGDGVYYERIVPAFEMYFETPHLMTDTFYIGIHPAMEAGPYDTHPKTYFSYDSACTFILYGAANYPTTYSHNNWILSGSWGGIFPIVQPNRYCDAPSRPRGIVYTLTNTVELHLPYSEGDSMTLSIARVGQSPDSGDLYNVTDSVMSVVLPDSGHYEARLRRYCERYGEFLEGAWSAPFPIQIFNTLGIMGSADGSMLTVTPNPASGKVEIDCGMADGTVALLDMQGRTLAELPSSQHVIDISGLPAGAYILRLTAPDIAPTVRKLIIARP